MEKKDLLGVRRSAAAKQRRKVVAPAKAGAGGFAKAIAAYLASDSYMYAPLVSAPPSPRRPPPPVPSSAAPPISTPEKQVTLVQQCRCSLQASFTAC